MDKNYVILVAGGSGSRMKSALPKQFIELEGVPILMRTIEVFLGYNPALVLIVVLPKDQIDYWQELCRNHKFTLKHYVVAGGKTRFHSVRNGLSLVEGDGLVAIHDGVRPLVSFGTIDRCFSAAYQFGNGIPCIPVYESVRIENEGSTSVVDRSKLRIIQTPQVFSSAEIKKAYEQSYLPEFTDDASVMEHTGATIHLVEGNRENIKITDPVDLLLAGHFLKHA